MVVEVWLCGWMDNNPDPPTRRICTGNCLSFPHMSKKRGESKIHSHRIPCRSRRTDFVDDDGHCGNKLALIQLPVVAEIAQLPVRTA
jgi:hypothetical protein